MEKRDKSVEKTCLNCSAYLPASTHDFTEFGLCLNDEAFEPFIEELLEDVDSASCQALVQEKKYLGDRPACPSFDETECIDIDDNSPLGRKLRRLADKGELTPEALEFYLLEEQLSQIDWRTVPIDRYEKPLGSKDPAERNAAIESLGGLISLGNSGAFQMLLGFLAAMPPPRTIDDVHLKMEILRRLSPAEDKGAVAAYLIDELYRTSSNNTTRQWISDIFQFLRHCPWEVIQEPLEGMLSDKRFSQRFREKVDETLWRARGPQRDRE